MRVHICRQEAHKCQCQCSLRAAADDYDGISCYSLRSLNFLRLSRGKPSCRSFRPQSSIMLVAHLADTLAHSQLLERKANSGQSGLRFARSASEERETSRVGTKFVASTRLPCGRKERALVSSGCCTSSGSARGRSLEATFGWPNSPMRRQRKSTHAHTNDCSILFPENWRAN